MLDDRFVLFKSYNHLKWFQELFKYTDLQSHFRLHFFLLENAIISNETNPCLLFPAPIWYEIKS